MGLREEEPGSRRRQRGVSYDQESKPHPCLPSAKQTNRSNLGAKGQIFLIAWSRLRNPAEKDVMITRNECCGFST